MALGTPQPTAVDGVVGCFGWGLRPAERLIGIYLAVTGLLLLVLRVRLPGWPLYVLAHAAALFALVALSRRAHIASGAVALLRRLLPLLVTPLLYWEVAALNDLIFPRRYFDASVQAWEHALFGGEPAVELRAALPWRPLSEYLHFAYFAYYLCAFILVVALATRRRWAALEEALTAVGLTFVTCLLWFIAFPVAGPYYTLPVADPAQLGWIFPQLVHRVLDTGSTQGAAFPSSHVAVAGAVYLMALRHDRRAAGVLTAIVPALALGTVYGGFHYAVDAVAGAVWAGLCCAAALPLHRIWNRRRLATGGGNAAEKPPSAAVAPGDRASAPRRRA